MQAVGSGLGVAMQIIAACPLVAGQEVFNTFGELGNAELCCKYGFCLRDNPFSSVPLAKPSLVGQLSSEAERKERCQYLEEQRSDALPLHCHTPHHASKPMTCLCISETGYKLQAQRTNFPQAYGYLSLFAGYSVTQLSCAMHGLASVWLSISWSYLQRYE